MRIETEHARTDHRRPSGRHSSATTDGVDRAGRSGGVRDDDELARLRSEWGTEPGHR